VRITGDELELLLSKSFALECLRIAYSHEIIRVTIPCLLQRLNSLQVVECDRLRAIESNPPNLSSFRFEGFLVGFSFANLLLVKSLEMSCIYHANVVSYALTKLPSMFPNVEALTIHSFDEVQSETFDDYDHWYAYNCTWNIITLRHLLCRLTTNGARQIPPSQVLVCFAGSAFSPAYDYLSLVSFFDASPLLETFILSVSYCS